MAENASTENGQAPKKELTPYEKMPLPLRLQWDERLFNVIKQRNSLINADAVLSYAFVLWVAFASVSGLLYMWKAEAFPIHLEFCYSLAGFLVYYAVIGFVRRQTERYLVTLCAQNPDSNCTAGKQFAGRKPFLEEHDPPVAKLAFRMRKYMFLPRRGLAQSFVVLFQFIAGFGYVLHYVIDVVLAKNPGAHLYPSIFWVMHVTITGGGLLILLKNAGFLVDTKKLLSTLEKLLVGLTGHAHSDAEVTINESEVKKPCDEKNDEKK